MENENLKSEREFLVKNSIRHDENNNYPFSTNGGYNTRICLAQFLRQYRDWLVSRGVIQEVNQK